MRILALHGYMQNSTIMRKKMEALFGKNKHDIVCLNGTYNVCDDSYGWWLLPNKDIFNKPHTYCNIEDTLNIRLEDRVFDLIVGFSQGSVAATILLDRGIVETKHVVLMSGSDIMDVNYLPKNTLDVNALGIIGDSDTLCSIDDTNSLLKHYKISSIMHHKYGHVIPTHKDIKEAINALILN